MQVCSIQRHSTSEACLLVLKCRILNWRRAVCKPVGSEFLIHLGPPLPVPSRHNDLPWQLLKLFNNRLNDSKADLNTLNETHTNIPKLKDGFVGGQVHPLGSPLYFLWACLKEACLLGTWAPGLGRAHLSEPAPSASERAGKQTHVYTGVDSEISGLGYSLFPLAPSSGPRTCLVTPKTKTL